MLDQALAELGRRWGMELPPLDEGHPVCFKLGALDFCLEALPSALDRAERIAVLSLVLKISPYDRETLARVLQESARLACTDHDFRAAFGKDNLLLMAVFDPQATAVMLERAVLSLKSTYYRLFDRR